MTNGKQSVKKMAEAAKKASHAMATATTEQKNEALSALAKILSNNATRILKINQQDIDLARNAGLSETLVDRLSLQHDRLQGIITDLHQVIRLPDPIGEVLQQQKLNDLEIAKSRTPIGVIGVIYESRPNVTIDISGLTIKSGNCAILRGGSETLATNQVLTEFIQQALKAVQLPEEAIQLVSTVDRSQIKKLLQLHEYVDLIIPRGGAALHHFCRENSTIPVITGGIGICHLFVDESADVEKSLPVIINAKTQRPTVCNALDTLLIHKQIASSFLPNMIDALHKKGVVMHLDESAWQMTPHAATMGCKPANQRDWDTEWLSLTLGIKIVASLDEAIHHIVAHSSGHSDGILTQNMENAERFIKEIDSAAVYVNASTRFTDGGQLGLGAEVAISTQKLHARGPMGLNELTSYKWIIHGNYSTRK